MQNTLIIVAVVIFISLSACKKDDNNGNNTIINTSITNGFPPGGTSNLNGFFYAQKLILVPEGNISYFSEAGFSKSTLPMTNYYYLDTLRTIILGIESVGTVKINSTTLKWNGAKSSSQQIYIDSLMIPDYSNGVSWYVGGNANFNSFNTSVTRGFPRINNVNYLPDSISKSQPLIIHTGYNNYANTDSIMVGITDGTNKNNIFQYFAGKDSVFTFTIANISGLSLGSANCCIKVYAKNFSNIVVNNKRYVFAMHTDLIKFILITQ